jgi:uncharacterized protein YrzB (UPF0473 family)
VEKVEVGEVFTISDSDDVEQEVEVLGTINLEENEYVAVCFVEDLKEESDEDIDIFFLKVDPDGDLTAIETDEEFEKVSVAFDALMEEDEEEE